MRLRLIRLVDCAEEAWANGRGVTRQLLRDGEAPEPWNWRLSVATVSDPGPFSSLLGIDRILVCTGDVPLSLRIDGRAQKARPGHPVAFAGESEVASTGTVATQDVNVMVRRATTVAEVAVLEAGDLVIRSSDSEVTAFVALAEGTVVGDELFAIGDTLVLDDGDAVAGPFNHGRLLSVTIRSR